MEPVLTSACPICEAAMHIADDVVVGELIMCEDCGTELEITGVDPLDIQEAPEVEEDWGE